MNRIIHIIVGECTDCPYREEQVDRDGVGWFCMAMDGGTVGNRTDKLKYNIKTHSWPIPDNCPLPGTSEDPTK